MSISSDDSTDSNKKLDSKYDSARGSDFNMGMEDSVDALDSVDSDGDVDMQSDGDDEDAEDEEEEDEKEEDISKMYFSHWKIPGVSERMWSVNLDASISGEYQTLGEHSGQPSE